MHLWVRARRRKIAECGAAARDRARRRTLRSVRARQTRGEMRAHLRRLSTANARRRRDRRSALHMCVQLFDTLTPVARTTPMTVGDGPRREATWQRLGCTAQDGRGAPAGWTPASGVVGAVKKGLCFVASARPSLVPRAAVISLCVCRWASCCFSVTCSKTRGRARAVYGLELRLID